MASPITSFSVVAPGFWGLNTQDSPSDMDPKFAQQANNCVIDKFGRVGSRKGWVPANTTSASLGSNDVEAIGELVSNAGVRTTLCAGNGKLFKLATGALTELTYGGGGVAPVITSNNWQMVMLNGAMLFWQRAYDCLIFDPALSATEFRRLSEHPLYSGSVPQANCALAAYGRIWAADTAADKNTVYWSDTLTYMKWTGGTAGSLNLYGVWPQGGDEIVALAAHNNTLIIFGRRQILIYSGADNPSTMELADALDHAGCVGRDTVATTPFDIMYLSDGGVTSIRRTIQEKSAPLGLVSKNVNDDLQDYILNEGNGDTIKAAYSPIDSFYVITFKTSMITFCFNMQSALPDGSSRVTTWTLKPKCYCYSDNRVLLMGFAGYIGNYDGYDDNGSAYRMSYYSSWVDFGDPVMISILKKIILTIFGAVNQVVTFKWGFDYNSGGYAENVTISTGSTPAEYNVSEFGIGEYSAGLIIDNLSVNAAGAGKVIQVGVEVDTNGFPISVQRLDIFTKNGGYKV